MHRERRPDLILIEVNTMITMPISQMEALALTSRMTAILLEPRLFLCLPRRYGKEAAGPMGVGYKLRDLKSPQQDPQYDCSEAFPSFIVEERWLIKSSKDTKHNYGYLYHMIYNRINRYYMFLLHYYMVHMVDLILNKRWTVWYSLSIILDRVRSANYSLRVDKLYQKKCRAHVQV